MGRLRHGHIKIMKIHFSDGSAPGFYRRCCQVNGLGQWVGLSQETNQLTNRTALSYLLPNSVSKREPPWHSGFDFLKK